MEQCTPIGLSNISYKVITKLLDRCIRECLPRLVGPTQCVFTPKRHGHDNIVVALEIFHSMQSRKGNKGWMTIKIDLENAYDHLKWEFIKETLEGTGFPSTTIDLI